MVNLARLMLLLMAVTVEPTSRIPPPTRAVALMALLGILLLGMLLIVATLLGGHWVRRWGAYRRGPAVPPDLILGKSSPEHKTGKQPKIPGGNPDVGDTMFTDDTLPS